MDEIVVDAAFLDGIRAYCQRFAGKFGGTFELDDIFGCALEVVARYYHEPRVTFNAHFHRRLIDAVRREFGRTGEGRNRMRHNEVPLDDPLATHGGDPTGDEAVARVTLDEWTAPMHERHAAIVRYRARDLTLLDVAERTGVTESGAARIIRALRKRVA